MEVKTSLKTVLKRLRLSGVLHTLPERIAYARKTTMAEQDLLELILQDEIDRREQANLAIRLGKARCDLDHTFENFDWNARVTFDRDKVRDLFSLAFIDRREDVAFMGPAGVGKTMLAESLGHAACRAGKTVLSMRAESMLKTINQSRADNSTDKVIRRFITPDILIVDDFGLRRLDDRQSSDFYEIIIERHRRASTIITSNRTVDEWTQLFADPILGQSALDRFAHNAHQIIIEGESYRPRKGPNAARFAPDKKPDRKENAEPQMKNRDVKKHKT
jgi:DNA replication protein DnaC